MRPDAAAMRSRPASHIMASIVSSVTPANAPRQPAWAAPIDPGIVPQEHRRAVCGKDAEQQARSVGDYGVGVRALVVGHG